MLANICEFLLFCFAIISIIRTIQSAGNQITPIRFVARVSNEQHVRTVDKLKTFNNQPVHISSADLRHLSTRICSTYKDYQSKLKSRNKLERKAEDVKCSFCVFARSNISYLKSLVEKLMAGEPLADNEAIVKRLEDEAKTILHLLLMSDLETGKWLWVYLLKIVAVVDCGNDNGHTADGNPLDDDQLLTGVSDFIEYCKAEQYLPAGKTESELMAKHPKLSENMFHALRESGRLAVSVEFLYLKPFWDDDRLLFRQMTLVNVDWTVAKQRHRAEVAVTREFVENRAWVHKPYGRLDHQHLVVKILDARFYCYLSVVLYVYEKQLHTLDPPTLKRIKDVIYYFVQDVLSLTAFKDEFLVLRISELQIAEVVRDVEDIREISARVRAKANRLLNDLNGAHASESDRLSFDVTENQLSAYDFTIAVIENFNGYLKDLNDLCSPFKYKVILHFMDVVKFSTAQYV